MRLHQGPTSANIICFKHSFLHNKVLLDVKYANKICLTDLGYETKCRSASETETNQLNLKFSYVIYAVLSVFGVCNTICICFST